MDTRVNYALVGLFVILLTVAMIVAGLWLSAGIDTTEYRRYSVYTTDSVAGLAVDSPVTYRGVGVGRVERIVIDRENPQQIHLVLSVAAGTPVSTDTVATLQMRGITGIGYVNLSGGYPDGRPPQTPPGEPYPVISYKTSFLGRLDTVAIDMLDTLEKLAGQVGALLSKDNRTAVAETLDNLQEISASLAANQGELQGVLNRLDTLIITATQVAETLPSTLARLDATLREVEQAAATVNEAGAELAQLGETGQAGMTTLTERTLPAANALLLQMRQLAQQLSSLTAALANDPSMLIFGPPERRPGPGE